MDLTGFDFAVTNWARADVETRPGSVGEARSRTRQIGALRVRLVEYSAGYEADHWCTKGHIVLCLEGNLETTLQDGRVFHLDPGMSYEVADELQPHRSATKSGAKLVIID